MSTAASEKDIHSLEEQLADRDLAKRMAALKQLKATVSLPKRQGTNVHVHTNHSFSVFRSPCEAAWAGAKAGVEVYGVNDFFTTAGVAEFKQACAILSLPATFSLECISMDRPMEAAKVLMNDPGNPGKIYFCGKGVTRSDDASAAKTLAVIRGYQEKRNRGLIEALAKHFAALGLEAPTWNDVSSQTPAGNTTERHVARACMNAIEWNAKKSGQTVADVFSKVVGAAPKDNDADRQNQIRGNLLKAGKACYVPEDPNAFPPVEDLRKVFLSLGAIPTYPVLGNPLTDGEKDIGALCDRLAKLGFFALELIPARNTDDRVAAVIAEATRRGWPVTDGTEHNPPAMEPLHTKWGMDDRFRPHFLAGAQVVLGHQALRERGESGYIDDTGALVPGGYDNCLKVGRLLHANAS